MPDIDIVLQARKLFTLKEQQSIFKGEFVSFYGDIATNTCLKNIDFELNLFTRNILQDIWNIGTLLNRLEWMQQRACEDEWLKRMWRTFASIDIDHFHIELRSIMDYVARIIALFPPKKKQTPDSFRKLKEGVNKFRVLLGTELADIIQSAEWFPLTYKIRDGILHQGQYTLVFGDPKEGILFQIYDKTARKMINSKLVMYNEFVAYFDRYAVIYFSYLLLFLEKFSNIVRAKLNLKNYGTDSYAYCGGFDVLTKWMDILINSTK